MRILGFIGKSILLVLPVMLFCAACAAPSNSDSDLKPTSQAVTTESGLVYEVIETGSGPGARAGETALIHETTQLADGTMITDTWEMNHPIRFLLGGDQVIDGLDEAVTGMRVGERRKLIVPPSLSKRTSYPENGLYGPEDTLYYNVILLQTSEQ
jgi:FKBP-type peptidyl-prolyl cis-trans isomerase